MASEAGAAPGGSDDGPRIGEVRDEPLGQRRPVDGVRCRSDDEAHPGSDAAALEQPRGNPQVLQPAIGAAAEEGLVNPHLSKGGDGLHPVGRMRDRDERLQGLGIDAHLCRIVRILIWQ